MQQSFYFYYICYIWQFFCWFLPQYYYFLLHCFFQLPAVYSDLQSFSPMAFLSALTKHLSAMAFQLLQVLYSRKHYLFYLFHHCHQDFYFDAADCFQMDFLYLTVYFRISLNLICLYLSHLVSILHI